MPPQRNEAVKKCQSWPRPGWNRVCIENGRIGVMDWRIDQKHLHYSNTPFIQMLFGTKIFAQKTKTWLAIGLRIIGWMQSFLWFLLTL